MGVFLAINRMVIACPWQFEQNPDKSVLLMDDYNLNALVGLARPASSVATSAT